MSIRNLLLFLIGHRGAILALASDRRAIWVGLLFVLSAGFAREYDGEDLLREPWHLLIPLGASLLSGSVLFLVLCAPIWRQSDDPPKFLPTYRSFLTLFWMTAPLAWLYAIPYERFLAPPDAVRANLLTLALVALWRVVLMVRVGQVATGWHPVASFFLVMAFADGVALAVASQLPVPVIALMGGVRLGETEMIINNVTINLWLWGVLSAPIWVIGALVSLIVDRPRWQVPAAATPTTGWGMWALAIASIAIWAAILPFTQVEQARRWKAEHALKSGRIDEALDYMSAHAESDFPPGWDPPPRSVERPDPPHILDVMEVIAQRDVAPWVRQGYVEKFRLFLSEDYFVGYKRNPADTARIARILQAIPEGPELAKRYRDEIKNYVESEHVNLSNEDRKHLQAILALAGEPKK